MGAARQGKAWHGTARQGKAWHGEARQGWFFGERMKTGTGRHPKTLRLMQALKINRREAVGLLELLWEFTAEYSPDGDLSRWGAEAIASAVDWPTGRGTELIDGLLRSGWIDGGEDTGAILHVHDWLDHCPEFVKKRIMRRNITKVVTQTKMSDKRRTTADNCRQTADNGGQCPPTQPNPTQPQPTTGTDAQPEISDGTTTTKPQPKECSHGHGIGQEREPDSASTPPKNAKRAKSKFEPPGFEEFEAFCREKGFEGIARQAYDYYAAGNWHDSKGEPVRSWRQKLIAVWFREENRGGVNGRTQGAGGGGRGGRPKTPPEAVAAAHAAREAARREAREGVHDPDGF